MADLRARLAAYRQQGRARRVFLVVGAGLLIVGVLVAPALSAFGNRIRAGESRHGFGVGGNRSVAELASALRAHPAAFARVGLTPADVRRVADRLDARRGRLEDLERRRDELRARAEAVLGAAAHDSGALLSLRNDARALAGEAVDETFQVLVEVLEDLTPAQRQAILRYGDER